MRKTIIIALLAAISAFASCQQKGSDPVASIMLAQPAPDQTYKAGETIFISGVVNGQSAMHGYKVCIIDSNGDSLCQVHNHTHASRIDIVEAWTDSTRATGDFRVVVSSAINHDGDEVKREVAVHIVP